MSLVVAIDAGGTKLAAALVEPGSGELFDRQEVPTEPQRGAAAVLKDCVELARRLALGHSVVAVGIGVPELVSLDGQKVLRTGTGATGRSRRPSRLSLRYT